MMTTNIAENLTRLRGEIPENVRLIAVSKTKPVGDIEEAYAAGHRDFGENRIQEMADKFERLPKDIRWHMIGHVQGNKIKFMAHFVEMVHGMDKPKRFKELNKEAAKHNRVIDCLLQIHIASEESKFGFSYSEAEQFLEQDLSVMFPNVRLRGLMGMATFTDDHAQVRDEFRGLSAFYSEQKNRGGHEHFDILSMGMSGDFRIAIEEGSNMVRVGQAIFGARN
jgi:pyridoxal phosphate enzyme (YggS family)